MKKKLFTLAIASILTLGVTSFAQTSQDGAQPDRKECAKTGKKCDKRKDGKRCDKRDEGRCKGNGDCSRKEMVNPFEGLNLTAEQQTAIQSIPTPRAVMKAARDKKDSDSTVKMTPEMKSQMARDIRMNYLNSIKAVLTPDQYVQFLENSYASNLMKKGGKSGKKDGKGFGHDRKKDGDRKHQRDRRCDGGCQHASK